VRSLPGNEKGPANLGRPDFPTTQRCACNFCAIKSRGYAPTN